MDQREIYINDHCDLGSEWAIVVLNPYMYVCVGLFLPQIPFDMC